MEDNQKFCPQRSIKIDNYDYSYKDALAKDYSYRCKHRRKCGILIKITEEALKKYKANQEYKIKFTITSSIKEHKCKPKENLEGNDDNLEFTGDTKKKADKEEFINSLIYTNIQKPLSFHKINLKTNNVYLTNNQIKWLLQTFFT